MQNIYSTKRGLPTPPPPPPPSSLNGSRRKGSFSSSGHAHHNSSSHSQVVPSPPDTTTTAEVGRVVRTNSVDNGPAFFAAVMRAFYRAHNPKFASQAEKILAKWNGQESELMRRCGLKYGEHPLDFWAMRSPGDNTSYATPERAVATSEAPGENAVTSFDSNIRNQRRKARSEPRRGTTDSLLSRRDFDLVYRGHRRYGDNRNRTGFGDGEERDDRSSTTSGSSRWMTKQRPASTTRLRKSRGLIDDSSSISSSSCRNMLMVSRINGSNGDGPQPNRCVTRRSIGSSRNIDRTKDLSDSAVKATSTTSAGADLKRLTVVLDLDETLIHTIDISDHYSPKVHNQRVLREQSPEAFVIHVKGETLLVRKRPGVDQFLERACELFDLYLYTAGEKDYATAVVRHLDPKGNIFRNRFFRSSCILNTVSGEFMKDLDIVPNIDLCRGVLVDNNPASFSMQPNNGILIESFYISPVDRELPVLFDVLCHMNANCADVRGFLAPLRAGAPASGT